MIKEPDGRIIGRITVHPAGYGFVAIPAGETVFVPRSTATTRSTAIGSRSRPGPASREPKVASST